LFTAAGSVGLLSAPVAWRISIRLLSSAPVQLLHIAIHFDIKSQAEASATINYSTQIES
jgi:hypothetical protein